MDQTTRTESLPALRSDAAVGRVEGPGALAGLGALTVGLPPERFAALLPAKVTRRERQLGREIAYRAGVQQGIEELHRRGALTIGHMHDHTHQCLVAGFLSMNARVRAIADPDDQAEIALLTLEQKAMFKRHQLGLLEAGAYAVAKEVERELYQPRRSGLKAWFQDNVLDS